MDIKTEITRDEKRSIIKVRGTNNGFIHAQNVEANLLFEILQELKEINKTIKENGYIFNA